jgi:hypothetical protein
MANPNPSPETRFQKGKSANPGGMTAAQRKARDELREALAGDSREVHDALMRLIKNDNPQAIVYAHQVLHGKEPDKLDARLSTDNPAEPLTTEQLLALASATKPSS